MSKLSPLGVRSDERVAAFIDGPNLYSAAKALGFDMDYKKLLEHLDHETVFFRAYYYTPVAVGEDQYSPIKPLLDWLGFNGYHLVTKPMKEVTDETGRKRQRGNMAVELTVDMLSLVQKDKLEHILLFSGDSDYLALIVAVQALGVRVTVVSAMTDQVSMVSDEVRRQADRFVNLKDVRNLIARPAEVRDESDRRVTR